MQNIFFKHKQIFNNKLRKCINQISLIVFIFQEVYFQKLKKLRKNHEISKI
jgi:hypothetical protein